MSDPRVIVPYVGKPPNIQRNILAAMHIEPEYIDVSGDNWNYWRLLSRLWSEGEQFMILEHDMLPWPGAIHLAWQCEEPWCVYPYLIGGRYSTVGHGCVKYGVEILEGAPNAVKNVGRKHWSTLDSHTIHAVRKAGFKPHVHQPPIIHLNAKHSLDMERPPTHVRRDGRLEKIDPISWHLGWVPEATGNHIVNDDAAARAAERTVIGYPRD